MKALFLMISMILMMPLLAEAQRRIPMINYYCAVETQHEGILCSNIKRTLNSSFSVQARCNAFASSQNLPLLESFSDKKRQKLYLQQKDVCDMLVGKGKWQCFMISKCDMSSSISNVDMRIFAPYGAVEEARDICVEDASAHYMQALKDVSHGCGIAPDAVMMQF